ncbi:hypothetical protein MAMT_01039 [Methylacidimicrobium tartarophylax]|uniref:HTH-like domain-containing protein n=1 Tax=Methylacidimicrobium tartarophylax TaxID=1041768 RepID=A0A5E6M9W0_9BACT|nr:IS3 family transposase [Methylacidimicrobium tartarophylax]VVM06185.1 hypothetical protein MAMT_01039 [Methylacidimicrobium tartarophylax]
MIDSRGELSVRRHCELLGLDRSGLYYEPLGPNAQEIALCHRLDELYTAHPFYGVRRMTEALRREGGTANPKRVRRLIGLFSKIPADINALLQKLDLLPLFARPPKQAM